MRRLLRGIPSSDEWSKLSIIDEGVSGGVGIHGNLSSESADRILPVLLQGVVWNHQYQFQQ